MEKHIIIGAGPAGLTAAWELAKLNKNVLILESDPRYVGGLSRTVEYKGYRFDIGGHRFYTKSDVINQIWHEMLPNDFIDVPRLSRIYYDKKFFPYPLDFMKTLKLLGLWRSFKAGMSYLDAQFFPRKPVVSFEDWVVNNFGYQLYATFFKTYTEKVWNVPCTKISKDWAAQRIRGLSFFEAVRNALLNHRQNGKIKTLIKTFTYPRYGPGQLWESVLETILEKNGKIEFNKTIVKLNHENGLITSVESNDGSVYGGTHFYITMPLKDLINGLNPPPPRHVLKAGTSLIYRDFLTVALIIDQPHLFPDNWIYVHDSEVHVGRIQNYKNWSKEMVPDQTKTCLGMEYFCSRGDELWELNDEKLIKIAAKEVEQIGLAKEADCIDGCVIRMCNVYPIYDTEYKNHLETIKNWLNSYFQNVYPAGRMALHNYNSQDHSMMASLLNVRNMNEGLNYDVWSINTDEEYAEEGKVQKGIEERLVPQYAQHS